MRSMKRLSNLTLPAGARCSAGAGAWRCLLGLAPLELLPADLPAFVAQSSFDLYQSNCALAVASAGVADRSRYFQVCAAGARLSSRHSCPPCLRAAE